MVDRNVLYSEREEEREESTRRVEIEIERKVARVNSPFRLSLNFLEFWMFRSLCDGGKGRSSSQRWRKREEKPRRVVGERTHSFH